MNTLIKDAGVLALDDFQTEYDQVDILIQDSRILSLGPDLQIPADIETDRTIDARGKLAMPGLVNGHIHTPETLPKARSITFIYIAPYIPEWCCAYGLQEKPVRFLLHWDCNRNYHHYFPIAQK